MRNDSGDPSAMGDDDDVRVQDETTETREEPTGMVFEACRIGRVDIIFTRKHGADRRTVRTTEEVKNSAAT